MSTVPPVLVRPLRRGYCTGEVIERAIYGLDGEYLGEAEFSIGPSPGSGFAGQVYRAFPIKGVFAAGGLPAVAIKVLRPASRWKEIFRDCLFWCCFQTSFAPRWRVSALRCGLLWQELLRTAAECAWGVTGATSRPLGYFWDPDLASFAELHTWVDGRPACYAVDTDLLQRLLRRAPPADHEMNRKRAFMARLAALCRRLGAVGLARQYEWYTGVSQDNVLSNPAFGPGQSEFVAVDFRPGLAVPFFLPLSPVHAALAWQGLRRGRLTLYDETDFSQLGSYLSGPAPALISRLKAAEAAYRLGLPDLWHTRLSFWRDRPRLHAVRDGWIGDWERAGRVSPASAARLHASAPRFWLSLALDHLPLFGPGLLRLLANERFRQHLLWLARSSAYRRAALAALQARDLSDWELARRITPARRQALAAAQPRYLGEKLACSWLPARAHRLLTDPAYRWQAFQALLVHPLRLSFSAGYRQVWLAELIEQQCQRGLLDQPQSDRLLQQAQDGQIQLFLRDFGVTLALEAGAKLLYLILALYGLSAANYWPLALALWGPVSPSGIVRTVYVLVQLLGEVPRIARQRDTRLLLARLLALGVAPWRFAGNLFAPLEICAYYGHLSLLLADYSLSRLVRAVPILGGRGRLLEYWAFLLFYNLPLALWYTVAQKISPPHAH